MAGILTGADNPCAFSLCPTCRSSCTPVDSWPCPPSLRPWGRFRFFFEPSRVSEALCRRQEPREGVPKRARACERGGEARRREPRGRLTTTYRTINARLPPDCERLLRFNFFSLSLRLFPENRSEGVLAGSYWGVLLLGPFFVTLSSLRCVSGFPLSRRFLRSVSTPVRQRFRGRAPSVVFRSLHSGRQLACIPSLRPGGRFRFSLSPLGSAKRFADVRSPERARRSELELVSEAAKRVGASLVGG